jgi:hypothetical protein
MTESPQWMKPSPDDKPAPPGVDTSVPHPSRVWDYWLGGNDNFAPDREVGEQILLSLPDFQAIARADREFLGRAVRYMIREAGIRQFLDIGTGIPTANNTHEVAQAVAPDARIVYVDNDPIVLAHARALLTSTPEGATNYLDADLREPETILERAAQTLDFDQPIGLTLLATLEFIPSTEEAQSIVSTLLASMPSGSHLAITQPIHSPTMDEAGRRWNESGATPVVIRSLDEVEQLFTGVELVEPGLVPLPKWRPESDTSYTDRDFPYSGGVGRKS